MYVCLTSSNLDSFVLVSSAERCAIDESLVALRMKSREHSAALSLMQVTDNKMSASF